MQHARFSHPATPDSPRRYALLTSLGALLLVATTAACGDPVIGFEDADASTDTLVIGSVSFKTEVAGRYVSAQNNGGGAVVATATTVQAWEKFALDDVNGGALESGDIVFVRAGNGRYLQAANGGGSSLNAASTNRLGWESFRIVKQTGTGRIANGDTVGLQTITTSNWVSAENGGGGAVFAYGASLGAWERFVISGLPAVPPPPPPPPTETTIANVKLQTTVMPRFVGATNGGGSTVVATATAAQAWESFSLVDTNGGTLTSGDSVYIRASGGQYLQAVNGGGSTLNASATTTSAQTTFRVTKRTGTGAIVSGDQIGLQTSSGAWISATNGGGSTVVASGAALDAWETFVFSTATITPPPPPTTDEPADPAGTWRSALYPRGWRPTNEGGSADSQGRFLQDYSYAGYHRGETPPPYREGAVTRTVDAALGNGSTNATSGIQSAIDAVCSGGGGVVRLPAGTYIVRLPSDSAAEAIRISCSRLVLRGDGPATTRIVFDDPVRARDKAVISLRGSSGGVWDPAGGTSSHALTGDALAPTRSLTLSNVTALAVGDYVGVRNDVTAAFRAEHRMDAAHTNEGDFWPTSSFRGLVYPRRVTRITGNTIELDAPTRYPLKTRDAARVNEISGFIEESGIESLSIGMVYNTTTSLTSGTEASHDEEYKTAGTTPYQVHASRAVNLERVHDAWLYDVDTFAPTQNGSTGIHVLSNGFLLGSSAFRITIEACDLGRPQYRGGGGNGYLVHVQGNDNLFVDDSTTNARHGFIYNQAVSGNVILRGRVTASRLSDDTHRFLSHANLYDGMRLDRAFLQAVNRGTTSTGGGHTATQQLFWNTYVVQNHGSANGCAVETAQFGHGYAIGSTAAPGAQAKLCPMSFTNSYWATLDSGAPTDYVEGQGTGATLHPASLYEHQLSRRCVRQSIACEL